MLDPHHPSQLLLTLCRTAQQSPHFPLLSSLFSLLTSHFLLSTFPFSLPTSHAPLFPFHPSLFTSPVSFSIGHLSFWIGLARAARQESTRDQRRVCSYRLEVMDDFSRGRQPAPLRHRCCHRQLHLAAGGHLNRSRSSGATHPGMGSVRRNRTQVKQRRLN